MTGADHAVVVFIQHPGQRDALIAVGIRWVAAERVLTEPVIRAGDGRLDCARVGPFEDVEFRRDELICEDVGRVAPGWGFENRYGCRFGEGQAADCDLFDGPGFRVVLPIARRVGAVVHIGRRRGGGG